MHRVACVRSNYALDRRYDEMYWTDARGRIVTKTSIGGRHTGGVPTTTTSCLVALVTMRLRGSQEPEEL